MVNHAQQLAADPAHSAWVSASAGTGKTKVLTDRVLRLLLQGTLPDKILCLTYTRAAAAEMRERITREVQRWATQTDDDVQASLRSLLQEENISAHVVGRARSLFGVLLESVTGVRIETIHAFCQSLLRRFPLEAGISPHFTLMDEWTQQALYAEARQSLYAARLREDNASAQAGHEELRDAIGRMSEALSEAKLSEVLSQLLAKRHALRALLESPLSVEALRERLMRVMGLDEWYTEAALTAELCYSPRCDTEALRLAVNVAAANQGVIKYRNMAEHLGAWLDAPSLRPQQMDAYLGLWLNKDRDAPLKPFDVSKELAAKHPELTEIIHREQERVMEWFELSRKHQAIQNTLDVFVIAQAYWGLVEGLKNRRGLMDYDDMLSRTHTLLTHAEMAPWVLYKLDGGIDHLLIDEAQDTSPLQWQLVAALTEEFFAGAGARETNRTLFVVGDEKQSIYSFQGAEPKAFGEMRRFFEQRIAASEQAFHAVSLATSYRSAEPVLALVDAVLAPEVMRRHVAFDEAQIVHQLHWQGQAGVVELWPVVSAPKKESAAPWALPGEETGGENSAALLATTIARTLRQWLDERTPLEPLGRPIEPRDVMILVRKRAAVMEEILRALRAYNIPVAGADRLHLMEDLAVNDLLALIRFALLPEDDLTLAALLKSPLVGFSEEALFTVCHERGAGVGVWQSLQRLAAKGLEPYQRAAEYLATVLNRADATTPFAFLATALNQDGGRLKLAARLGQEIDDPIDELLHLADTYEAADVPSLQGFLHWLETGQTTIKRDMEQTGNTVRVMTVHGSKGLQAPIVFLPDTMSYSAHHESVYWLEQVQPPLFFWLPNKQATPLAADALKEARKERERAESARLFYVALTRAEYRLVIGAAGGARRANEESWYYLAQAAFERLEAVQEWECPHLPEHLSIKTAQRYAVGQTSSPRQSPVLHHAGAHIPVSLPAFARAMPPEEETPPRPLVPSRMEESEAGDMASVTETVQRFQRGVLVHRLLQTLPEIIPANRKEAALRFLSYAAPELGEAEHHVMAEEVTALMLSPLAAPVFGPGSLAEVPISGLVENRPISAQVDRLYADERAVWVVDFKTHRHPPATAGEIPEAYYRQMALYRQLLECIYPGRAVRCALLYTTGPVWFEV